MAAAVDVMARPPFALVTLTGHVGAEDVSTVRLRCQSLVVGGCRYFDVYAGDARSIDPAVVRELARLGDLAVRVGGALSVVDAAPGVAAALQGLPRRAAVLNPE